MDDRRSAFKRFAFVRPYHSLAVATRIWDTVHLDSHLIPHDETEFAILYELAAGLHDAPDVEEGAIIHCGMYTGGTLCSMATGVRNFAKSSTVYGVDPYYSQPFVQGEFDTNTYRILRENLFKLAVVDCVCPVTWESILFLNATDMAARIIFIDTTHVYDETKLEIELAVPLLVDNGWLVLHDYWERHPAVIRAVNEFIDTQTDYQLEIYTYEYPEGGYSSLAMIRVKHENLLRESTGSRR